MKNSKKISREKLKSVQGGVKTCPPGMHSYHCPGSTVPQCYWDTNTLECPDL